MRCRKALICGQAEEMSMPVTPYDVPPDRLIARLKEKLKGLSEIKPPSWLLFVKTGSHVQRAPSQPDFWYIRCASLLRKAYIKGSIGVNSLRVYYGGRKNRGVARQKFRKAGGSIIRKALQQLEKAGLLEKLKTGGRRITPKGISLLNSLSKEVKAGPSD